MSNWFAIDIDRDILGGYGPQGLYLYHDNIKNRIEISAISYDENILTVKDTSNNTIQLSDEPNIQLFKDTVYTQWQLWDTQYGAQFDDDRIDYVPWVLKSKEAIAIYFNLIPNNSNQSLFYKFNNSNTNTNSYDSDNAIAA